MDIYKLESDSTQCCQGYCKKFQVKLVKPSTNQVDHLNKEFYNDICSIMTTISLEIFSYPINH